jgi:ubiquinone/menaquinone biosynthesis C-methylase UbiE
MRGKERAFRERLIQMAHLKPGERVLDVGCGTGTLAIAAKRRCGASSAVSGIDASSEMIARAKKKAVNAGVEIDLQVAICEALPFQTGSFDVAFSTMMLHHLGAKARRECANEIRRVLTPGGRWFVVDFEGPARHAGGILSLFHRHGHIKPGALSALVSEAGLNLIDKGPLGFRNLHFVLAESPGLHIGEK